MQELAPLIYDLAVMLGVASFVIVLFQRIHQPVVLGYLVAGMIIGPNTPYILVRDIHNIHILSELGVIFLMFYLGIEFSFQKLIRVGFSASLTGFIEVVLMIAIGYAAGLSMGWSTYNSLFLGAALSISSTTIIIKAIDELHLKTKRFALLIFGVLIVEDLLAILLLVALSTIVITKNVFSFDMVDALIRLILVVGTWFLVGYFLMPPLFRRISTYISQETLTIISVALCLILVCIAATFHYSTALGAFIMGSILAETALVHRIEDLIRPIRDIFAAVFFISVGMLIDPIVIFQHWWIVLYIALITVVGKLISTFSAALVSGQDFNTSVRVGCSMAQIGEFSFIIVALGRALNATDEILYPIVVAVSGITTFTTPYLIRVSESLSTKLESMMPKGMKNALNAYAIWISRSQATKTHPYFRRVFVRLLINALIVAVIFTIIHYVGFHYIRVFSEQSWLGNILYMLLALALSAPFIWGMLFTHRIIKPPKASHLRSRMRPFVYAIWFLTLAEVTILSLIYFNTWSTAFFFLILTVIFFTFFYRHLGAFYSWFEGTFISNIQTNKAKQKYSELAPWDTYLAEIKVSEYSTLVGKTLAENLIRYYYGVNIVAIQRGKQIIAAPRGEEVLYPHDKLIVLGDDEQLETFRKEVDIPSSDQLPTNILAKFKLHTFLLERGHEFIGKSIKESGIREMIQGLIVGLERNQKRILNPESDVILQANDLIYIVGETGRLKKFKKHFFSAKRM